MYEEVVFSVRESIMNKAHTVFLNRLCWMREANNYKTMWIIYDRDMQIVVYYGKGGKEPNSESEGKI